MRRLVLMGIGLAVICGLSVGCADQIQQQEQADTATGTVHETHAKVETGLSGLTVEQENIKKRMEADNKPGAMKFIYFISPYTGDVVSFCSVKGKVTSSGKRLKPKDVPTQYSSNATESTYGIYMMEQMGDDGSYGSSSEYIYWWDVKGVYHQVSPGACMWHISDQPIRVKKTTLRLDASAQQ
jgi:hypothetical protein